MGWKVEYYDYDVDKEYKFFEDLETATNFMVEKINQGCFTRLLEDERD